MAICPHCGGELNAGQLLAQEPRITTPAMVEQRKKAGQISADKRRKK